jgi:hypothetical protein
MYQMMTEMVIVDVAFACFYNLVTDYRTSQPAIHYYGKAISSLFISMMILNYLYVLEIACTKPWRLGVYQTHMVLENLNPVAARSSVMVRSLNVVFRLKIILLMACLIMLQNHLVMCLVLMILIQTCCFIQLIYVFRKNKKVFIGKVSMLSHILIDVTILFLLIICSVVFTTSNSVKEFEVSKKRVETSTLETFANFLLVTLIILCIVLEFLKILSEIRSSVKDKLKKKAMKRRLQTAQRMF